MIADYISTSELGSADPSFAMLNGVRSRRNAIKRNLEFCLERDSHKSQESKSEYVKTARCHMDKLDKWEAHLANTSLIDHEVVCGVRSEYTLLPTCRDHLEFIFGEGIDDKKAPPVEPWIKEALKELKKGGNRARLADAQWRMREEITYRAQNGWYIVFDTITVEPWSRKTVFHKGSTVWRDYTRTIERAIGVALYGSVRNAERNKSRNPYYSYCCVLEPHKSGELHMHAIHCMRELPDSWKRDPNCGKAGANRYIMPMKKLWHYGWSFPVAVRFGDFDAFGDRLHWAWPIYNYDHVRAGEPIDAKPPAAIASYLCKYLTKAFETERLGESEWRTRYSRNFGQARMKKAIKQCRSKLLISALQIQSPFLSVQLRKFPNQRLRKEMLRELIFRLKSKQQSRIKNGLRRSMILKSMITLNPRQSIVERLRNLTQRKPESNSLNIGNIETAIMKSTDVSELVEIFERVFEDKRPRFEAIGGTCHVRC